MHLDERLQGEGGEALTVSDRTEAWIFHILPDPTGTSAIWAAQRIPDNHISIVANAFVIREIQECYQGTGGGKVYGEFGSTEEWITVYDGTCDWMYSSNMHTIAEELGWWSRSSGPLHFLKVLLLFVYIIILL